MGNESICIYSLTQRNIIDNIYDELEAILETGGRAVKKVDSEPALVGYEVYILVWAANNKQTS